MIDRLIALIAFAPVGLNRLVQAAMPALAGRDVVVPVALGLLVLVAVPATHAGLELVTTHTVPSEVIERRVGDATMLEVVGEAMDTGLPAGTDDRGRPLRWLVMRDGPDRRSMLLVRTPEPLADLRTRLVTARVQTDDALVTRAVDALAERGAPGSAALEGRYLVEAPDAAEARTIDDPAALASLAEGTAVRIELLLTGTGIAGCTLDGACDARALAAGQGRWLQRAVVIATQQPVLLETAYPPPVFTVDLVGEQVREAATVDALLATRPAQLQFGWVRVLRAAILEHDPGLPIDRDWRGVIVVTGVALLLLVARRRPYPAFRHEAGGRRAAQPAGQPPGGRAVEGRALGHLAVGDGPPVDAAELPLRIAPGGPGEGPRVTAHLPSGEVTLEVPATGAGVSGLERGRLAWVRRSRPALWLHWYRTDLRVAFATGADRDAAAASLASISARPAPPAPPATPPPPPPRRRAPASASGDEPPPTWRRPRPRGAR